PTYTYLDDVALTGTGATAPGTPTAVSATAGNGQATVSWTAPPDGGSTIRSYTITPYAGGVAQPSTTINGSPPATTATITGLTNGTTYTFTVTATNGIGTGSASSPSNAVTPSAPTVPGTPTNVTAAPGNGQATVSWTAPSDGGSTIRSYTIIPYAGGVAQPSTTINGSPPATTATITGLTNGTTYTFTVTATNGIGTGLASSASNTVTPAAAPGAPTGVTAVAGNGQATVSWTAPFDGGSPINSYTITPYVGSTAQPSTTITGSPPATTATVTGLTNGTSYTFTVTAVNAIAPGPASVASNAVTPLAAPGIPTNVTASGGNGQATVTWTAPSNGGSAIVSYTVTPYVGSTAQPATTVTGSPAPTSATVTGLTNGTMYTFTVKATNGVGTGLESAASNPVTPGTVLTPSFIQQVAAHAAGVTSLTVTPGSGVTVGNRLVVLVGVWSSGAATAQSVTDSAGNIYTEVLHFAASEKTELSVWTAPVTAGGGTRPAIKVTPSARADVGAAALEYSGLSTAAGAGAIDQTAQKSGTTSTAATVSSGATGSGTTAGGELAMGFYVDSGFGDSLTAGSGFTGRSNVSNTSDIELLAEDQLVALGAKPNATAGTGANTTWLMATVVFKHG
ncbi:MAG: fibronectin type III domain-containing protein, partial [Acidimicrobiia bacterium]|nr:fibronectin type III domain-containing protein [Acidimicrobiia bacterium]